MSESQPENVSDDLGSYSVDDEDQLQPIDTLDQGLDDYLDPGFSPPDRPVGSLAHGVTAEEQHRDETIDQRIRQEVPEEGTAYGAPEPEGILGGADDLSGEGVDGRGPEDRDMVGGDDPDAIPADRDVLDGGV